MGKPSLILLFLVLCVSGAYAQKVKYKDIYALLSTKQFEQAEPFLKRYLRETTDNPNAYLFMGNIYQEKSSNNDILKQTALCVANMDSAIFFYDKAYKTIDDREVRKNKEYYQNYNRRDLRTGEFGVKLSDIQFDIEKRIEALKEKTDRVKMTKHFFSLADSTYKRSNSLFLSIQSAFPSLNQLYLRADEQTVKDLTTLSLRFDSCMKAFDRYKGALATLSKTGYNQKVSLSEIAAFKTDGRSGADFFSDDIRLWDYKKFADGARTVIEKEILPMRAHLVSYDMEINKLREKLNSDSVSVRSDLTKLINKLLDSQLKQFDPEPLPMALFSMKTTDLAYRSSLLEHKPLRDSADLHLQITLLGEELSLLKQLDSAAAILSGNKFDEKAPDYAGFISSTYNNPSALKSFVSSLREYGIREQKKKTALMNQFTKGLNYIVDGADSIPLSTDVITTFKPLVTTPEKFTTGLSLRDTTQLQGYFYTITPARVPEVKAYFPVDKSAFTTATLPAARALAYSDAAGQIFYVLMYSGDPGKEKFPATVAKIYRSDGLAWKANYPLTFAPSELLVSDAGELIITDGAQRFVVDKNGKVK